MTSMYEMHRQVEFVVNQLLNEGASENLAVWDK